MAEPNVIVSEWISKAEADWDWVQLAASTTNTRLRDGVVFHAQQCIEKLFKACLLVHGEGFRKIHDLSSLSCQLHAVDPSWTWGDDDLDEHTDAGVLSRYPGFDTTDEEVAHLVVIATRLRNALLAHLHYAEGDSVT